MSALIRIAAVILMFGIFLDHASAQGFGNNEALLNSLRKKSATPAAVNSGSSQLPANMGQSSQTRNQETNGSWNQQMQNSQIAPTAAAANAGASGLGSVNPDKLRNLFQSGMPR